MENPIEISILNKKELAAADKFMFFLQAMQKLNTASRKKVYHRLQLLHLLNGEEPLQHIVERTTGGRVENA